MLLEMPKWETEDSMMNAGCAHPAQKETVKESTEKPPLFEDTECLNNHHPEEEKGGGLEGLDWSLMDKNLEHEESVVSRTVIVTIWVQRRKGA